MRPASLREHCLLPRDSSGKIVPEKIRSGCKNYLHLEGIPEEQDLDGEGTNEPPSAGVVQSDMPSQPDGERFPSECSPSISPSPSIAEDVVEEEKPIVPEEIPIPDDDDDGLFG